MQGGNISKERRMPVVLQMLLFMTLGNLGNSSYSPLNHFIQSAYGLTNAQVGIITSVVFAGGFLVSLMSGLLVDRLGPYTAIRIAFGIIASGATVIFLSDTYYLLISGYFFIGFGYGIITPATNSAMMKEYYPRHARGMGVKQSGVPLGAILSVGILTAVTLFFSLKYSYLVLIAISVAVAFIIPKDGPRESSEKLGSGYLRDLLSAGMNKSLLAVEVGVIFLSWGQQTLLTFIVDFERFRGIAIVAAEILLIILLVGSVFGRNFWAQISDRMFHKNRVHTLSTIMAISGILFILLIFTGGYYPVLIVIVFFLGMNAVGWNSAYVTVISEMAPRDKVGVFSGVSLMFTGLGTIVGTPISGVISDSYSYSQMWVVLGASLAIMALVFLFVGRKYVKPIE